jgi:hypothetical protein
LRLSALSKWHQFFPVGQAKYETLHNTEEKLSVTNGNVHVLHLSVDLAIEPFAQSLAVSEMLDLPNQTGDRSTNGTHIHTDLQSAKNYTSNEY